MGRSFTSKTRILDLIRVNPYITQQELGERLGLTRSSIASHIAQLIQDGRLLGRAYVLPQSDPILVAGGTNWDRVAKAFGPVGMGTSNPVKVAESMGGVARNVAENLARLGLPVRLLTAVGDDPAGQEVLRRMRELGVDTTSALVVPGAATGTYTALLQPGGEMVLAMSDMAIMEHLSRTTLLAKRSQWGASRLRVVDCNLPAEALAELVEDSHRTKATLVIVAVSEPKMSRLPASLKGVSVLILNRGELAARLGRPLPGEAAVLEGARELLAQGAAGVVVTLGAEGVLCVSSANSPIRLPAPAVEIVDVTGAGDAFSAGVVAGLFHDPSGLPSACALGSRLSALTLSSAASVSPSITPELLTDHTSQS